MKYKRNGYLKVILIVGAILFLMQGAHALCLVSIDDPEVNRTYPYSINVPLEFNYTEGNCSTCKYNLYWNNSPFTYDNVSIDCDGSAQFDIDFNGNYFLSLYALNSTLDEETLNVEFHIDRSEFEDSKPYAAILGVIVLIMIAVFIFGVGRSFSESHIAIKLFFTALPIIVMIAAVFLCILIAREYIKVPAITDSLVTFNVVYLYGVIIVFMVYLFIYLFAKAMELAQLNKKAKLEGLTK